MVFLTVATLRFCIAVSNQFDLITFLPSCGAIVCLSYQDDIFYFKIYLHLPQYPPVSLTIRQKSDERRDDTATIHEDGVVVAAPSPSRFLARYM